ncbi:MAG: phosphate/phosphite/phosphonate ABC transporter substrate-binding protein [Zetaproteobacteria bacterium]|nr:phosphate/phosphite/phosphonate ABC transporter substrate-binding protein [Zetaproteobacteria bacterium]
MLLSVNVWVPTAQATEKKVFKIGVVPQFEARRLHEIWTPILNTLEEETGYHFELVGSPTIPAFEKEFSEGAFDFAYMNPYHALMAEAAQGYQPLVRDVKRSLFGILVVAKDGDIKKVEDLQGKTLAFPAPNALAASLQMRQELHDNFKLDFKPIYVKTHDSVYYNVLLGDAAAGGGVQKTFNSQAPQIRDNLLIIHQTTPVAPHPIMVHPRVNAVQADKVKQALLHLGSTDVGKVMLANIPMKQIGEATMADYEPLKQLHLERFVVESY